MAPLFLSGLVVGVIVLLQWVCHYLTMRPETERVQARLLRVIPKVPQNQRVNEHVVHFRKTDSMVMREGHLA